MAYTVHLEHRVERDLRRMPKDVVRRLDALFQQLAEDPRPDGVVKLAGKTSSGWRVRVGDYRILYQIEGSRIYVYRLKHRRDAYRP